jgi:type I restriction enzyme S subunit
MREGFKNTPIGEIPSNWDIKILDHINQLGTSISYGVVQPGAEDENGVLFIRGGDIKNNKIGNRLRTISKKVSDSYSRTLLKGGELLISLVGYPGECAIVPESLAGSNIARQVGVIRPNENSDKYYIQQYLSSPIGKKNLLGNLVGSAQQVINLNMLRKVQLPLPPLPEQQKIAEILSTVDAKIEIIDQQILETQELKKGLMQQLLTKGIGHTEFKDSALGKIPKSWEVVKISKVADVKGGKRIPKGESLTEEKTSHPYIRVADMFMGGVSLEKILYVPENIFPIIKKYTISKDDLFISVAGTLGIVGEIPNELDGANLTENADKLSNIKISKLFLLQVLLSPIIQTAIEREKTNNAQPKLALAKIRSFEIPKPSKEEQLKIAEILSTTDKKLEVLSEKKTTYQELKQGLMQQLLTGKVRV